MLLILFVFASADALSRFGCHFDDENYALSGDDVQYSEVRRANVEFESETQFRDFYREVDEIKRNELNNMIFNTLDPFYTMFDAYVESKNQTVNNELPLSDFYDSYRPTYPPSGDDGVPALMRVYEKIVQLNPGVVNSFVLGTTHMDVHENVLQKWNQEHTAGNYPSVDFHHDELVGLIRVSVAGELGFILINMREPKGQTPIVMDRKNHELNKNRVEKTPHSNRKYFAFKSLYTYINGYITVAKYKREKYAHDAFKDFLSRWDILYTERSLCSFLQTTVKRSLFRPWRYLKKYNSQGEDEAFTQSSVLIDDVFFYTISSVNISAYSAHISTIPRDDGYIVSMAYYELRYPSDSVVEYLRDTQTRLNMTGNIVDPITTKMRRVKDIMLEKTTSGRRFSEELDDLHQRLTKPVTYPLLSKHDSLPKKVMNFLRNPFTG